MVGEKDQEVMVGEEERACLIYPSSGGLFGFGQIKGIRVDSSRVIDYGGQSRSNSQGQAHRPGITEGTLLE